MVLFNQSKRTNLKLHASASSKDDISVHKSHKEDFCL